MRTLHICSAAAAATVLLLGPLAPPATAQAAVAADCPFRYALPAGWSRVPLLSARVDPRRSLRFSYGAGAENVAVLTVGLTDVSMARMQRSAVLTNALMVEEPSIAINGTPAQVLRGPNRDAVNGKGGSDAWQLFLPLDDEEVAVIRLTMVAGRGVTAPSETTVRALLASLVPGACLRDEDG